MRALLISNCLYLYLCDARELVLLSLLPHPNQGLWCAESASCKGTGVISAGWAHELVALQLTEPLWCARCQHGFMRLPVGKGTSHVMVWSGIHFCYAVLCVVQSGLYTLARRGLSR